MRALLAAVLLAPMLGGCVFVDTRAPRYTPEISGTVTRAGEPVAGASVRTVSRVDTKGKPVADARIAETTTAADGSFRIDAIRGRRLPRVRLMLGPADPIENWSLQLQLDGRWVDGWHAYGIEFVPEYPVVADCDPTRAAAPREIPGTRHRGTGTCVLSLAFNSPSAKSPAPKN